MKGTLFYSTHDPEMINSLEGWSISLPDCRCFTLSDESEKEVRRRLELGQVKSGDEFEFEIYTDCYYDKEKNLSIHTTKARIVFERENLQKLFLIDIDGTICDDIKNEDSHLYPTAEIFPKALEIINKWYNEGNVITFFTARESKDRQVTLDWLDKHGFKYHGLVMDKPRIKDQQEYVWIDNRKVRAVTYLGNWSDLKEVDAKIQIFE